MKKKNLYLSATLWIPVAITALLLLGFVVSGFDLEALVLPFVLWVIPTMPFVLFIACSFIFGLKGTGHLAWGIGSVAVYGWLTYFVFPSCQVAADPRILYGTLEIVPCFALAFGCGYLWRIGAGHRVDWQGITKIFATLCVGLLMGYITYANLREMGGVNDTLWTERRYNADKTLFYDRKLRFSPFPARVLGVRYYNKHGKYAGGSAEQPCNSELSDMRMGEVPDGSADILLHKRYKPVVTELLADCKDAFRKESGRTTVYLFYKNDTLRRIEADHYENGIISQIRRYGSMPGNRYEVQERFDELGVPQNSYVDAAWWRQLWRIVDFRVEAEVPRFGYGYDDPDHPELDQRLRNALDYHTPFEQARDSLKAAGEMGDNLSIALLIKGFAIGTDTTLSVAVDPDSYYGEDYNIDFKSLETVKQMETVCDALALCRIESGMTERMVRYPEDYIPCPRIRIKENSGRDKYMILYLLNDRAVSSDFKFRFVFDPSIHTDEHKRNEAGVLWKKMQQIIESRKSR